MVLLIEPGGLPFVPSGWVGPGSVLMVVVGLFVGGWCEEIGYRGVMYRAMAERCHPWLCVIVNGAFFGVCICSILILVSCMSLYSWDVPLVWM